MGFESRTDAIRRDAVVHLAAAAELVAERHAESRSKRQIRGMLDKQLGDLKTIRDRVQVEIC